MKFERSAGEWERGLDVFFRSRQSFYMEFFNSAVDVLQTLVIALGGGLGVWGVVNLLEGYGNDNLLDHRVWRHYESRICPHVVKYSQLENHFKLLHLSLIHI